MHTSRSNPSHRHLAVAALALAAALTPPAASGSAHGRFSRTLKVTGAVELDIQSGSGSIHVHHGADGAVQIDATVLAHGLGADSRIQAIEGNPPIEQRGNSLRIGYGLDSTPLHDISISYEVTVPRQTSLVSRSGSGDQAVEDILGPAEVSAGSGAIRLEKIGGEIRASAGSGDISVATCGGALHLQSGSGSITVTGAARGAEASSGSGDLRITQTGPGNDHLNSASGSIYLEGANGSVDASSSSGGISIQGSPAGPWQVRSVSGSILAAFVHGASFDLSASTISGKVDSELPVTVTGEFGPRRYRGSIHGGGPAVKLSTVSGSIRIR